MELGLSLGDTSRSFPLLPKNREPNAAVSGGGLGGFCMALGINGGGRREMEKESDRTVNISPPLQLDLLPLAPIPLAQQQQQQQQQNLSWLSDNGSSEGGSSGQMGLTPAAKGFDVNRLPPAAEEAESSPTSTFHMDLAIYRGGAGGFSGQKRDSSEVAGNDVGEQERASSRASDDDENGLGRKKLRLSKEQSAYLEESFKEHSTLNPKQKLALAKQLNLRPRQVEVWFQNRRARTKLKQTEVDCEYLKRCCETLTEENRRLQKEIQELRALKSTSNPFYMQLPATTLTMCPSCERVATTTTTTTTTSAAATPPSSAAAKTAEQASKPGLPFPAAKTKFFPFSSSSNTQSQAQSHQSAAS